MRPTHAGDLNVGVLGAKEATGRSPGSKNRKGGAFGPRLPVRCRPPARSGRSVNLAGPSGPWITRSASWFPTKRRRDPTLVLVLRRVATTWLPPRPGGSQSAVGFAAQGTLTIPPYGMRRCRQTEALCAYSPLRFQPPMAMDDLGLACPVSFPATSRSRRISPPAPSATGLPTQKAYITHSEAHGKAGAYPHYPP